MRNGRALWSMKGHVKHILTADFSPNGYHLATGMMQMLITLKSSASVDGSVRIWDLRRRKVVHIIPAHNSVVSTAKYQPRYGNYLVTASYDGKVRFWSNKNWGLIKTFNGHEDKISCLDISPVNPVNIKMEVEDDDDSFMAGYQAPVQLVTSSFDRSWKLWAPDILSSI